MATLPKVLIKRTPTPNLPPAGLQPGELSVEMADPLRLWIGVPPALHPDGRKEITSFVHVGDAPPVNPPDNKLWWESDTGIMWIYYNDGTSKQWVAAVSGSGSVVTGDFLPLMGGTLTGDLKIENLTDNSRLILNPKEMVDSGVIIGQRNSLTRWVVYLGMGNETGGNVGGDFGIQSSKANVLRVRSVSQRHRLFQSMLRTRHMSTPQLRPAPARSSRSTVPLR